MLKRLALAVLAALAIAGDGRAQTAPVVSSQNILTNYDLDSTTFVYPYFEPLRTGPNRIQTAGSSTTVTAVDGTPFAGVGVGDELNITASSGINTLRWVTAKASDISITVDTAITLVNAPFSFRHLVTTGTGWFKTSTFRASLFTVQIDQANTTTGITWQMECRTIASASTGVIDVGPVTVLNAAVPYAKGSATLLPWDSCRLGLKMTSTDDGGDTGANAEKINLYFGQWR